MATFRNVFEIDVLIARARRKSNRVERYCVFLEDWVRAVNAHTDGWAYWSAGSAAGGRLADLIEASIEDKSVTTAQWSRAIGAIKAAATKQLKYGNKIPVPELQENK